MNTRTQITLDPKLQRKAQAKADELGISFAEYVRRVLSCDLFEPERRADVSVVFDLVDEGAETDIARDKDKMIGDAVSREHERKTSRRRARVRVKSRA